MTSSNLWLGIGLLGQMLFSARFLIQWITSERQGRSVIPLAFWWLSLAGGVTLLSYALARHDPVFIMGQASGLIVYLRNLRLIRAEGTAKAPA
ncbi:lipid-A-disaccharide synthase N-terminal domain-containing protein [Paracoccus sp. MBLB3053]|uniref:Lipid-A-disaccharide synthase N-terminal domain-containing protein n=1 Tax=Paracoccus aurantius TaxID=3073814 RepID=A0ABU2HYN7_9RHOB|nr:lipid-A-disaccharide synthase N-terminal domain-containing protein [Paracoccus sp. MBLB3053]MDS9470167.1 lipid-A-disaccharide synthase N-terminal domain-containing protein [Paracoccus sp. MBLB3053]